MRKKVLFVSLNQFGYFSIYHNYCRLLSGEFDLFYLCFDHCLPRKDPVGVNVTYVELKKDKIRRQYEFYSQFRTILYDGQIDFVIIKFFKLAIFYKLLNLQRFFFIDIRTGSLKSNIISRKLKNLNIRFQAGFFDHIIVLSESLALRLRLPVSKTTVIPLGANEISTGKKSFDNIRLLYVGTLEDRRITDTITGLKDCALLNSVVSYDIIGFGTKKDEEELVKAITDNELRDKVHFHGRIFGDGLTGFFNKCNVGVAFVPVTPGYDVQPVTKIFEYMLSGMAVIATSTMENKKVVNKDNGVLIEDDPVDFGKGIAELYLSRERFDSEKIKDSVKEYTWQNIVESRLKPMLAG